jgi:archaetidylinositol phosphate synthase
MKIAQTSPERWNEGLLRPLERPALVWLAARMPRSVTPDLLTAIGFAGAVVTFAGYALSGSRPALLWLATAGLAINWFGDSLDGTLARRRRIERPRYGYYLDNSLDCIAALLLAGGVALSGYVRVELCFLALAAYLMLSALSFLRTSVSGVFQISYGPIGPTETRVGFAALNMLLVVFPPAAFKLFGMTLKYPDLLSLAWTLAMITTFLVCMIKEVRRLAAEEPARRPEALRREIAGSARSPGQESDDVAALAARKWP